MTASLRPFARSRGLRFLGVLAWMMLIVTSLGVAPLHATGFALHATHAASVSVAEHCHHDPATKVARDCCGEHAACCGGASGHACGCAAMCASVLPSDIASTTSTMTLATPYEAPRSVRAPSVETAPPLRPPSV